MSVTRPQLTFALSTFLALPLAVASPLATRSLLAQTDAGRYLADGGSIATRKLGLYDWTVFGGALVALALGIAACHVLAGLVHDLVYGERSQNERSPNAG